MKAEIAQMLTQGGGVIVNNASVSGLRNPNTGLSLYAASTAAAIPLTRSAAMEYAPDGIRLHAIRSEEHRVGKERDRTCRTRWSQSRQKKKHNDYHSI